MGQTGYTGRHLSKYLRINLLPKIAFMNKKDRLTSQAVTAWRGCKKTNISNLKIF
jgi:hypothetical protein